MQALIDYLETLEVTQGEGVGKPFPLFPWERRFVKGAFSGRGQASLTVARGNGKTTLLSGVAAPAEVGEGSWPLDSWPVEGPYGQSGDLLWRGGGRHSMDRGEAVLSLRRI